MENSMCFVCHETNGIEKTDCKCLEMHVHRKCYNIIIANDKSLKVCSVCQTMLFLPPKMTKPEIDIIKKSAEIFYTFRHVDVGCMIDYFKQIYKYNPRFLDDPKIFKYVLNSDISHLDRIYDCITNVESCAILLKKNPVKYDSFSESMQNNKVLQKKAISMGIINNKIIQNWSPNEILQINGLLLEELNDVTYVTLKHEDYFTACANNGMALEYVPDNYKNNKELVLIAAANNGDSIQFADPILCDDIDVIIAATNNTPDSFEYASERIKNDPDMCAKIISINFRIIGFMSTEIIAKIPRDIIISALP